MCPGIHRAPLQQTTTKRQHKTPPHTQQSYVRNGARINQTKYKKEKITRVHYPVLTQHTHTTTNHHTPRQPPAARPGTTTMCHPRHPTMHQRTPKTQLCQPHTTHHHTLTHDACDAAHEQPRAEASHPPTKTKTSAHTSHRPRVTPTQKRIKLLRKEVIQPHLPVRLPCYDFVPIANPTFDGSLTSLGHRLRVLPTFMT